MVVEKGTGEVGTWVSPGRRSILVQDAPWGPKSHPFLR